MVVGVLVQITNKNVDKVFEYSVKEDLIPQIEKGKRVIVPFASRTLEGFIVSISNKQTYDKKLKSIIRIVDEQRVLNDELLDLGKYMQQTTLASLISCYQVMLPKALKAKVNTTINKKYTTYYKLNEINDYKLNSKQKEIITLIKKEKLVSRKTLLEISSSSLKTLLKNNIITEEKKESYRLNYDEVNSKNYTLTEDQEKVKEDILNSEDKIYLLYGVTASGKTEVYISLIEEYLKRGKTAIVLVPEISLTPQIIKRFQEKFSNQIAAIHSSLSDGEKYDEYRRILKGEVKIVIGARSAIFSPLNNLGIIIIDEEHSDSYKQDSNPRYSTIDIAKERCRVNDCKLLLASATPSLESFSRALKKIYRLETLLNRVNNKPLPLVNVIDMNKEIKTNNSYFSKELLTKIKEKLENHEQIILLLNRRGYASFVSCKNCGEVIKCPHCDITLTYHKSSNSLKCHYCDYTTSLVKNCPKCGEESLSLIGVGTEKIEEQLNSQVKAKILRMDFDTTSKKGMHKKMVTAFKNHEYDILLGTQIVAKGLDFSLVTLVGVINADVTLNIPDFRSSEKTFSLLSQVAGRSGRANLPGEVVIQTFNPDHYVMKYVKNHDYLGFYKEEMAIRKKLKYAPYYYLTYIRISSSNIKLLEQEVFKIKKVLEKNLLTTIILGPSVCNVFKVNNIFRYSIILKYKEETNLYNILEKLIDYYKVKTNITIDIDFNPIHFN